MKNLKKVLSLVLALAMALSLMTAAFAADASDYKDYSKVTYKEAVDVMTAAGIFNGGDGNNFNPDATLNREQAAKIITYMLMGQKEADKLTTTIAPYADVAANRWSAGAIAYCTDAGIIAGDGNGRFNPTAPVLGTQFAKMLLVALGFLPDYGPMKKAEERARTTGKVVADGDTPMLSRELDTIKPKEGFKSNIILHFLIPALIVIAVTIGTYVIMGSAKTLEAFVLAVTYQAIVLLIQKAFNIREMIQVATEGIKSVVSAILILSLAYCINAISKTLGTSNYVISVTENWMTPVTLLALAFAVCAFMAFFTGTSWGVYAIMIPIVMPLAFNMTGGEANNLVYATIAAVMGGGCFGDHCSPLSDTTILSSLGAGSDHLAHTKTQLPYALTVAVITCIGYIIIGLCLK